MWHFLTMMVATLLMTLVAAPRTARLPVQADAASPVSLAPLVKEVVVEAAREDVWLAWTTAEGLQGFFGKSANVELRPGGAYEVLLDLEAEEGLRGTEGCRVLSFVEQEMLSFTCNAPAEFLGERSERTFVVLQLYELGEDRTRVRLCHDGWRWMERGRPGKVRDHYDAEWDRVLSNLERFLLEGPLWSREELDAARTEPAALQHFVYFASAREDFLHTMTAEESASMIGHGEHVTLQAARGRLVFGGPVLPGAAYPKTPDSEPFEAPVVAIFVIQAKDLREAQEIMEGETMIARGHWKARVQPFVVALGLD